MEYITQVIKDQDIQDGDAAYLLVKSLLKGTHYKSSKTKNQLKRLRTARHLLNALQLLLNTYSPRRPTKPKKSTPGTSINPCTGQSDCHEDFLRGVCQRTGGWNPVSVETGV
eukprot:1302543-Ditylum_brightwellii.AAC.1